jgi:3-polyprenyl-4-hydroxybenzoate decarboxylase
MANVKISIKKQYPFHVARIAHGLWGAGQMSFTKVIWEKTPPLRMARPLRSENRTR